MKKILLCWALLANLQSFSMEYENFITALKNIAITSAIIGLSSHYYFQPWCKINVESDRNGVDIEINNELINEYNATTTDEAKMLPIMEKLKENEEPIEYYDKLHKKFFYSFLLSLAYNTKGNETHRIYYDKIYCSKWYRRHNIIQPISLAICVLAVGGIGYF